ncbi:hypothetical protein CAUPRSCDRAFT_11860 [Caulochytrium protostelioides]|uniref:Uncharacterized protein n=1 Tax=Caulochytrium protostelioides TaxID=1555241 RepID=A0A4P9WT49_9FUNG|nr:hypothetical protein CAUPRSCDRAFT_11860 [Caulochytrium protostelioides]
MSAGIATSMPPSRRTATPTAVDVEDHDDGDDDAATDEDDEDDETYGDSFELNLPSAVQPTPMPFAGFAAHARPFSRDDASWSLYTKLYATGTRMQNKKRESYYTKLYVTGTRMQNKQRESYRSASDHFLDQTALAPHKAEEVFLENAVDDVGAGFVKDGGAQGTLIDAGAALKVLELAHNGLVDVEGHIHRERRPARQKRVKETVVVLHQERRHDGVWREPGVHVGRLVHQHVRLGVLAERLG